MLSLLKSSVLLAVCLPHVLGESEPGVVGSILNLFNTTCSQISKQISSSSQIIYPLEPGYTDGTYHWFQSSSQLPACVFNAGSAQDISIALKIIAQNKTPFAVKSGGHATNPGFSSTTGVQIWTGNLNQVQLSADKSIATVGVGQRWDEVYEKLDGTGVGVCGGRVPGPGVGGLTLGGGFSWHTNQYGLTADTVQSFNVVLPNGTISTVDSSRPDLFFALKGGLNRFGIVTSVNLKTHPQGQIWGALRFYTGDKLPALASAIAAFDATNKDPKAQMIVNFNSAPIPGLDVTASSIIEFFYDGPNKPPIFSLFDNITAILDDSKTQSFASWISNNPSKSSRFLQGRFTTFSVTKITPGLMDAIRQEVSLAANQVILHGGGPFPPNYEIDSFLDYGKHATDTPFPHANSPKLIALWYSWLLPINDGFWIDYMKASAQRLRDYASKNGILLPVQYSNYALPNTTADVLFGPKNAARMSAIRSQIDPQGVMKLTGGFDF